MSEANAEAISLGLVGDRSHQASPHSLCPTSGRGSEMGHTALTCTRNYLGDLFFNTARDLETCWAGVGLAPLGWGSYLSNQGLPLDWASLLVSGLFYRVRPTRLGSKGSAKSKPEKGVLAPAAPPSH